MGTQLVSMLERYGFITYEVVLESFVDGQELEVRPTFYQVRTLVSVASSCSEESLFSHLGENVVISAGKLDCDLDCTGMTLLRQFVEDNDYGDGEEGEEGTSLLAGIGMFQTMANNFWDEE